MALQTLEWLRPLIEDTVEEFIAEVESSTEEEDRIDVVLSLMELASICASAAAIELTLLKRKEFLTVGDKPLETTTTTPEKAMSPETKAYFKKRFDKVSEVVVAHGGQS